MIDGGSISKARTLESSVDRWMAIMMVLLITSQLLSSLSHQSVCGIGRCLRQRRLGVVVPAAARQQLLVYRRNGQASGITMFTIDSLICITRPDYDEPENMGTRFRSKSTLMVLFRRCHYAKRYNNNAT